MKTACCSVLIFFCIFYWVNEVLAQQPQNYVEFSPPATIWLLPAEYAKLAKNQEIIGSAAYRELKSVAYEALSKNPNPVDSIFYEGLVSNNPRRIETVGHLYDMVYLRACTWVYLVESDTACANQAVSILCAWAETCTPSGNDVNDNKLEFCFFAFSVLSELMKSEGNTMVRHWLMTIAQKLKESWKDKGGANRLANRLKIVLMYAWLADDSEMKNWVDEKTAFLLNECLLPDGSTTDFHQRDAMHYHVSCVDNLLKVAMIYRFFHEGIFDEEQKGGGSLRKSVDFVLPYALGEKVHPEWVNTKVELDKKRWLSGDPYYRPGKPWIPGESLKMFSYAAVFDKKYEAITTKLNTPEMNSDNWNLLLLKQIER